jgi:hypothetical protein
MQCYALISSGCFGFILDGELRLNHVYNNTFLVRKRLGDYKSFEQHEIPITNNFDVEPASYCRNGRCEIITINKEQWEIISRPEQIHQRFFEDEVSRRGFAIKKTSKFLHEMSSRKGIEDLLSASRCLAVCTPTACVGAIVNGRVFILGESEIRYIPVAKIKNNIASSQCFEVCLEFSYVVQDKKISSKCNEHPQIAYRIARKDYARERKIAEYMIDRKRGLITFPQITLIPASIQNMSISAMGCNWRFNPIIYHGFLETFVTKYIKNFKVRSNPSTLLSSRIEWISSVIVRRTEIAIFAPREFYHLIGEDECKLFRMRFARFRKKKFAEVLNPAVKEQGISDLIFDLIYDGDILDAWNSDSLEKNHEEIDLTLVPEID